MVPGIHAHQGGRLYPNTKNKKTLYNNTNHIKLKNPIESDHLSKTTRTWRINNRLFLAARDRLRTGGPGYPRRPLAPGGPGGPCVPSFPGGPGGP